MPQPTQKPILDIAFSGITDRNGLVAEVLSKPAYVPPGPATVTSSWAQVGEAMAMFRAERSLATADYLRALGRAAPLAGETFFRAGERFGRFGSDVLDVATSDRLFTIDPETGKPSYVGKPLSGEADERAADEFFQGGRDILDAAISPPDAGEAQFVEGLARGTIEATPAIAAMGPLGASVKAGQMVEGFAGRFVNPILARVFGGATSTLVGATEFSVAESIPRSVAEGDAGEVADASTRLFRSLGSVAQKVYIGDVEGITVDEYVDLAIVAAGGVLGLTRWSREAKIVKQNKGDIVELLNRVPDEQFDAVVKRIEKADMAADVRNEMRDAIRQARKVRGERSNVKVVDETPDFASSPPPPNKPKLLTSGAPSGGGADSAPRSGGGPDIFADETGAIPLNQAAAAAAKPAKNVYGAVGEALLFLRRSLSTMPGRMRLYNGPAAESTAILAERALNDARETMGKMAVERDAVLEATGLKPSDLLKPGETGLRARILMSLAEPKWSNDGTYAISPLHALIENDNLTDPRLMQIIGPLRDLIDRRGQLFEAEGILQTAADGSLRPFKNIRRASGAIVAPRIYSPEMHDIWIKGKSHPAWNPAIDAFAKASRVNRGVVEKMFDEMHDTFVGESPESAYKRTQAEFVRQLPRVPSAIKVNDGVVPILESNPFRYGQRLAEDGASRVGVVRNFGQEIGPNNLIDRLRTRFAKDNGTAEPFVETMRALSNLAIDKPYFSAGSYLDKVIARPWQAIDRLLTSMLMSRAMIVNIPEPLGNIRAFAGTKGLLDASVRLFGHWKATLDLLETLGAVTKDEMSLVIDPMRPGQSVADFAANWLHSVTGVRAINELQEKLAATAALEMAERFKRGGGTERDVLPLKTLGYSTEQARRLASGSATGQEYIEMIRRAPTMWVGNPQMKGDKSLFENKRITRALLKFQTYAQMQARNMGRIGKSYIELMHEAYTNTNLPMEERWKIALQANRVLANWIIGTTMAGTMAYFLAAGATGGTLGLKVAWNEAKDRPGAFLGNSFMYTVLAGPYGAMMRMATGDSSNPLEAIFPYFVATEVIDAVKGQNYYRDMLPGDRTMKLFSRFLPLDKVLRQAAVTVGFGDASAAKMDTAIRGYWRWRMENKPLPEGRTVETDPTMFRTHMRKAYSLLRGGGTPEQVEAELNKAVGIRNEKSARASLQGRMLLRGLSEDEIKSLRDTIGADAYKWIEAHDAGLELLIDNELR